MLRFWFGSGSPWAWRVQLALEEKRIPYDAVLCSFSAGDLAKPEFRAMNPHGKVPVIRDGDFVAYESQAILEYLEEKYPAVPLLPAPAEERAKVRMEELECTTYLSEAFFGLAKQLFQTPEDKRDANTVAERRANVRAEIDKAEQRLAARATTFLVADELTRADVTWIPFVEIAGRAGVTLDGTATPNLVRWRDRMRARASYQNSYPPHWRKS